MSHTIKSVIIGSQEWAVENLDVEHYRNGDVIPQVQNADEWKNLSTGAWCYYENETSNGTTYGKLYNWFAVNDPRGLAPEGWHIPGDAEWNALIDFLGSKVAAGGKLKALTLWQEPNTGATNESGFTALPAGIRRGLLNENNDFSNIGEGCGFWSSTDADSDNAWYRYLYSIYSDFDRAIDDMNYGLSVRCIKD
jgi:uncharacterized protein (TIGR02145 family)